MATTIPIPLTTLQVGTTTFGPVTFPPSFSRTVLTIDRTVANGLNVNPSTTITYQVELSANGTTGWRNISGSTVTGGILQNDDGSTVTAQIDDTHWGTPWPANQHLRAVVIIAGHACAVSGSLVIS